MTESGKEEAQHRFSGIERLGDPDYEVQEGHHPRGTTPSPRLSEEICFSEAFVGGGSLRGVLRRSAGVCRGSAGFSEGFLSSDLRL